MIHYTTDTAQTYHKRVGKILPQLSNALNFYGLNTLWVAHSSIVKYLEQHPQSEWVQRTLGIDVRRDWYGIETVHFKSKDDFLLFMLRWT